MNFCFGAIERFEQYRFVKTLSSKQKNHNSFLHVGYIHSNDEPCVIKILHQPGYHTASIAATCLITKELTHLRQFLSVSLNNKALLQTHLTLYKTSFAPMLFFTMPYLGDSTARHYALTLIAQKNIQLLVRLMILVLKTAKKLHKEARIIHGDLSMNNIMILNDNTAVFIDAEHACNIGAPVDCCSPTDLDNCYWSQDRIHSPLLIKDPARSQTSNDATADETLPRPLAVPKHDFIAFFRYLLIDLKIKEEVKKIRPLFRVYDKILSNDATIQHCIDFNLLLQQLQRANQPSAPSLPSSPRIGLKRRYDETMGLLSSSSSQRRKTAISPNARKMIPHFTIKPMTEPGEQKEKEKKIKITL